MEYKLIAVMRKINNPHDSGESTDAIIDFYIVDADKPIQTCGRWFNTYSTEERFDGIRIEGWLRAHQQSNYRIGVLGHTALNEFYEIEKIYKDLKFIDTRLKKMKIDEGYASTFAEYAVRILKIVKCKDLYFESENSRGEKHFVYFSQYGSMRDNIEHRIDMAQHNLREYLKERGITDPI